MYLGQSDCVSLTIAFQKSVIAELEPTDLGEFYQLKMNMPWYVYIGGKTFRKLDAINHKINIFHLEKVSVEYEQSILELVKT